MSPCVMIGTDKNIFQTSRSWMRSLMSQTNEICSVQMKYRTNSRIRMSLHSNRIPILKRTNELDPKTPKNHTNPTNRKTQMTPISQKYNFQEAQNPKILNQNRTFLRLNPMRETKPNERKHHLLQSCLLVKIQLNDMWLVLMKMSCQQKNRL